MCRVVCGALSVCVVWLMLVVCCVLFVVLLFVCRCSVLRVVVGVAVVRACCALCVV